MGTVRMPILVLAVVAALSACKKDDIDPCRRALQVCPVGKLGATLAECAEAMKGLSDCRADCIESQDTCAAIETCLEGAATDPIVMPYCGTPSTDVPPAGDAGADTVPAGG